MNLVTLGSKLSEYRVQLELSVEEVSAALHISPGRLCSIEAGALEPTGDEVLMLADLYKCDFKYFISNERLAPFDQTQILYRKHGSEFAKEDRLAIQEFLYLCETEAFLTKELKAKHIEFSPPATSGHYKNDGIRAAAAFRTFNRLPHNGVSNNLYDEIRQIGVHVFRRKLGNSNVSGLFLAHPTAGKCILVNYSEDVYRQRFSAAHELAHALFDAHSGPSITYSRPDRNDYVELRANTFASRYLMPPEVLRQLPTPEQWTSEDTVHWAQRLRVSCTALAIGLKSERLISEQAFQRINASRVPRSSKIDPELPAHLTDRQRERKTRLLERGLSNKIGRAHV